MSDEFFVLRCHTDHRKHLLYFAVVLECDVPIIEALLHTTFGTLYHKNVMDPILWHKTQSWMKDYCMKFLIGRLGQPTEHFGLNQGFRHNGYLISPQLFQWDRDTHLFQLCILRQTTPTNWEPVYNLEIWTHDTSGLVGFYGTSRHVQFAHRFYDIEGGVLERIDGMLTLITNPKSKRDASPVRH